MYLAALPASGCAGGRACFDGKLERPTIWRGAITTDVALAAQRAAVPRIGTPGLVACWDFSQQIPGNRAIDTGPSGAHARLVNLPTRAMTGASWTGAVHDWKSAPDQYGAIHFHSDDQGDLGWAESFALDIPADWPSGFYSAHIRNASGEDHIPFFVRPRRAASDIAFLVPTFTYQVYGAFVRPGRGAEIRERATSWGALLETPDMNPEFGLSAYNLHADGSGVAITSMRRPMLDTRPQADGADGPGRRWLRHRAHLRRQLHPALARRTRHHAGHRHRPRSARGRRGAACALSCRHRGPASGISFRADDAGALRLPRANPGG